MKITVTFTTSVCMLALCLSGRDAAQYPEPETNAVHNFNSATIRDRKYDFLDSSDGKPNLQIFCRLGDPKLLRYYFRSAKLQMSSSAEDLKYFKGSSAKEVYREYLTSSKWLWWATEFLPWRVREVRFPTFNTSCVGVSTSKRFTASVITRPVDPWNFLLFVAGISLFLLSPRLAKSAAFFYTSGTIFGGVAAILVLLFILSRSLPKGKFSYVTISVLWTMCLYFAGETWNRVEELFHEKLPYILVYLTTGAIIALITCYRVGPPSHPRTLDIIRCLLQVVSLGLIHLSSELVEVSTSIIIFIVFSYYFGGWLKNTFMRVWRRLFPPKLKLLTEEEFMAQASVETEKSLRQLREYCNSPECNTWKYVSRLKDPQRFASFVDGSSHLSDDELLVYESFAAENDDDDTTEDESEAEAQQQMNGSRVVSPISPITLARSPSRQGTPRPRIQVKSHRHQNGSSSTTTPTRRTQRNGRQQVERVTQNEYLTDDESPNNTLHTDDED